MGIIQNVKYRTSRAVWRVKLTCDCVRTTYKLKDEYYCLRHDHWVKGEPVSVQTGEEDPHREGRRSRKKAS